ncbi:MAG: FAD-dependent oxidoreductase [Chloroflexi bacterium]|nr:FAD-dependent oxidoreductase [Chloroflexota bacterium]
MTTDVIVLGAGGAGSAAAYYLARRGQRVLLLEQFAIDHPYGSSFGNSRIIRYMYDHATYVGMAKAAYPLWYALQDEAGERLLYETGGLDFGRRGAPTLEATLNAVKQFGIAVEQLTSAEGMRRYPQFRFDDDMTILYQRDYGLLNASACVKAHVRLAARHGAVVVENAPVIRIDVRDGGVEVVTPQGTHAAERLIVTAGAWTTRCSRRSESTFRCKSSACSTCSCKLPILTITVPVAIRSSFRTCTSPMNTYRTASRITTARVSSWRSTVARPSPARMRSTGRRTRTRSISCARSCATCCRTWPMRRPAKLTSACTA